MQIQVSTEFHGQKEHIHEVVEKALKKFSGRVTRVEVHLTNENKGSGPEDIRCVLEARVEHHPPTAVTHHAENSHLALDGAAGKLERALSHLFGKLRDQR